MTLLRKQFDTPFDLLFADLFNSDFSFSPINSCKIPYPSNVYEDNDNLYIELSAIGLEQEDLKIEMHDGYLNVSYNKEKEKEENEKTYHYRGLTKKSFNLSFKISRKWDTENIKASLEKGLLLISMPILEESKPKQVMIT